MIPEGYRALFEAQMQKDRETKEANRIPPYLLTAVDKDGHVFKSGTRVRLNLRAGCEECLPGLVIYDNRREGYVDGVYGLLWRPDGKKSTHLLYVEMPATLEDPVRFSTYFALDELEWIGEPGR